MSFLSHRRVQSILRADGRVERRGNTLDRLIFGETMIVSRALCHFERMKLPMGNVSWKSVQATKLAAYARSPMANPAFRFDVQGNEVAIWSWSKDQPGMDDDDERAMIPETVLHPALDNGARLVRCVDGFEGQVWRDSILTHSRWWPQEPDQHLWDLFVRAARFDGHVSKPSAEALSYSVSQASGNLLERFLNFDGIRPKDIVALVVLLALVPTAYLGSQWISLSAEKAHLNRQINTLSSETEGLIQARESAQRTNFELAQYASGLQQVSPLRVFSQMTEIASELELEIVSFELRDSNMTAVFEGGEAFSPADLVRAIETQPELQQANVQPARGTRRWEISARVEVS